MINATMMIAMTMMIMLVIIVVIIMIDDDGDGVHDDVDEDVAAKSIEVCANIFACITLPEDRCHVYCRALLARVMTDT